MIDAFKRLVGLAPAPDESDPIALADAAIAEAETRARSTRDNFEVFASKASAARERLDRTTAAERGARNAYDAAALAFSDDETDATRRAMEGAAAAQRKAAERHETARRDAMEADADRDVAMRAVDDADRELAEARRAKTIAELTELASLEQLARAVVEPNARIVRALEDIRAAAREIDIAHASARQASHALRSLGVPVADPSILHVVRPMIEAHVEGDPSRVDQVLNRIIAASGLGFDRSFIHTLEGAPLGEGATLGHVAERLGSILGHLWDPKYPSTPAQHIDDHRGDLAAALAERTWDEMRRAIAARREERERARRAALPPTGPAPNTTTVRHGPDGEQRVVARGPHDR